MVLVFGGVSGVCVSGVSGLRACGVVRSVCGGPNPVQFSPSPSPMSLSQEQAILFESF